MTNSHYSHELATPSQKCLCLRPNNLQAKNFNNNMSLSQRRRLSKHSGMSRNLAQQSKPGCGCIELWPVQKLEQKQLQSSEGIQHDKDVYVQHSALLKTKVGYNTQIFPLCHETRKNLSHNKKTINHVDWTHLDHNMLLKKNKRRHSRNQIQSQQVSMHLYEDVFLEDSLNFAQEAQNWLNLQWGNRDLRIHCSLQQLGRL